MKSLSCVLFAAALTAGCATDGGDDYPVLPQDGTGAHPGSASLVGRVCVATELGDRTCTSTEAGGLKVTLGTEQTTTAPDGTFLLAPPTDPTAVFTVTGTSATGLEVISTTSPFRSSEVIPAIDADLFAQMLTSAGVTLAPGTGSIVTTVSSGGVPVSDAFVSTVPVSAFGPFYASGSPIVWGTTGSGATGVMWVPGVTAGTVDLSFQRQLGGIETTIGGVQVLDGGITVLDTELPAGETP